MKTRNGSLSPLTLFPEGQESLVPSTMVHPEALLSPDKDLFLLEDHTGKGQLLGTLVPSRDELGLGGGPSHRPRPFALGVKDSKGVTGG